jgi:hypothetical protein
MEFGLRTLFAFYRGNIGRASPLGPAPAKPTGIVPLRPANVGITATDREMGLRYRLRAERRAEAVQRSRQRRWVVRVRRRRPVLLRP